MTPRLMPRGWVPRIAVRRKDLTQLREEVRTMASKTQESGPIADPLVWVVGKVLDLTEYLIRLLLEAGLNRLPQPKRRLKSRAMQWVAKQIALR